MAPFHEYQKISDVDDDIDIRKEYETDGNQSRSVGKQGSLSDQGFDHKAWFRKPSVFWLLPVFLLFNVGMGATTMPKMNIVKSLLCRKILALNPASSQHQVRHDGSSMSLIDGSAKNYTSSIIIGEHNSQCAIETVESATSMLMLYGNLIAGILGAIAAPFWGRLSDKYGRVRPLAAASTIVLGSETMFVLIASLPDIISLDWIYLAYVLEGLSGTFILIMALASSYASDCSSDSGRNVALGWFHGSMFFGLAAGPMLGGYLGMSNGESRPLLIFYVALALRILGITFLLVFVPESLILQRSPSSPNKFKAGKTVHKALLHTWAEKARNFNFIRIFTSQDSLTFSVRRNLIALASINTIMFGAFMGAMNVMLLYSEYTFEWGNKESGIFLSTVNFFRTIATMIVLPLAVRLLRRYWFRLPIISGGLNSGFDLLDLFLIRVSILSDVIGYAGYATASTGVIFTMSGAVAALGAIGLATSEASMTKLVGSTRTGELLGALGFLQAIARIVAPTIANLLYSWTIGSAPQLVFWGIAACFVAAGIVTFWAKPEAEGLVRDREEAVPLHAMEL
ncbi:hypothetical protein ACLMJK_002552 [Lecanora helva]